MSGIFIGRSRTSSNRGDVAEDQLVENAKKNEVVDVSGRETALLALDLNGQALNEKLRINRDYSLTPEWIANDSLLRIAAMRVLADEAKMPLKFNSTAVQAELQRIKDAYSGEDFFDLRRASRRVAREIIEYDSNDPGDVNRDGKLFIKSAMMKMDSRRPSKFIVDQN